MKVLVIDNYDSFTYNLVHMIDEMGLDYAVHRNDQINMESVAQYDRIVLSPGPGIPNEAGSLLDIIRLWGPTKPMLGICLGHQALAQCYGGQLVNMKEVFHGVKTEIHHTNGCTLFRDVPASFFAGRYHSWKVKKTDLPETLKVTAEDAHGDIMGIAHRDLPLYGIQFHPESVMTEHGKRILQNFIQA